MRERLSRALVLLQPAPLPVDLVDNPYCTDQWLVTVHNLHQAVLVLLGSGGEAAAGGRPAKSPESRADRLMRRFSGLIDGLPLACLTGLSPMTKLGLLRPLLSDLECRARRIAEQGGPDTGPLELCLHQYRAATAAMAARQIAPELPAAGLRPPQTVPSR